MKYILTLSAIISCNVTAGEIKLDDIYEKFNMRTIYSSYGQRLKYYCESYPKEYFSKENIKHIKGKKLELISGDDIWVFTIKGPNQLVLSNKISDASYNTLDEYTVYYDKDNNDWRANKILLKKSEDCVKYVKGKVSEG
ncbi:hypothetical protein MNBD_GAMMA10-1644 [hydrothermal vent metagenome]|uniref:Uncharacterized protein n=1 Tax=hydrothermal vent metagenome TaxID=652676 RepID=A0A3B0XUB5_9ZZZZ